MTSLGSPDNALYRDPPGIVSRKLALDVREQTRQLATQIPNWGEAEKVSLRGVEVRRRAQDPCVLKTRRQALPPRPLRVASHRLARVLEVLTHRPLQTLRFVSVYIRR
ncbi:MAG: hypothetical protein QOI48_3076 [Solirubrobacteraceae bacterium]|jgi:hypothetical protein|nr:hypothetical protein [Solirubrobacteraceae bacterium]